MKGETQIPDELTDYLLTFYCSKLIAAVNHPSPEADELIRSYEHLHPLWQHIINQRVEELSVQKAVHAE